MRVSESMGVVCHCAEEEGGGRREDVIYHAAVGKLG